MKPSTAGDASAAAAASSSGPSTSASTSASTSTADATHYIAKRVLRGSAVLHVAEGCFRSPDSADVVLAKETSLELVAVGDDGVLQSICEQDIFGIIKDIGVLQWHSRHNGLIPQIECKDLLVVLSDSGKLSLLYFCSEMHRFFAIANIELSKPGNLRHHLGRILAIDRESNFVAVSSYEDKFALIHVSVSQSGSGSGIISEKKYFYPPENEDDARIITSSRTSIRGTIWTMRFISVPQDEEYYPVLAMIINRKGSDVNDLSLFGYDSSSCVINHLSSYSEIGPLVLDVSEIPETFGFALLLRVGDALLLDLRNPTNVCCIQRVSLTTNLIGEPITVEDPCPGLDVDDDVAACALLELRDSGNNIMKDDGYMDIDGVDSRSNVKPRIVCSWSWEPPDPVRRGCARLLFCLDDGEFHILEFTLDVEGAKLYTFEYIDRTLPCRPLFWMKNRMIIGFVEMGDGMIFKLGHRRLLHKSTIQNVAPILDLAIADYHGEKQDQMFACCGMSPEGSLRVLRNGVNVDRLLKTEAIYQGVTGLWTLRMKATDAYHSFLVLSFVEETRILSVGLSFNDISDAVGFQPDVCTLACGLVADNLLVQIYSKGVKVCLPTVYAHPEGAPLTSPICTDWYPAITISVGAVGHNIVVVATSNPCCLYVLGVRSSSSYQYELYATHHVQLQYEVSCISIPQEDCIHDNVSFSCGEGDDICKNPPPKVNVCKFAVIGTHRPSVEIISLEPGEALRVLTIGTVSVNNALGAPMSGCIPENVRFVAAERFYILAGLRNGMLLRFESETRDYLPGFLYKDSSIPSVNTFLQLISIRRIGITPVLLVPIHDSANADIIVLSDRPWLLHAARHSLAYSSISFLSASHVTPVSSVDCPNGLLFVAESCLHLVELVHGKRLNAQKFSIGGTPRKVLYHNESRTLLVLRTGLNGASSSSDVVQVDPQNGVLLSRYKCEPGETAKCMQIAKIGNDQVLIVGTTKSAGRPMMSNGEAESSHCVHCSIAKKEQVYFGHQTIAQIYVFGFTNENPHRIKKCAVGRTRFTITCLKTFASRIAVGDCRDGVLFYSYNESHRKLELVYSDPAHRLVGDIALLNCETAVVSDRRGSISVLSCTRLEVSESPQKNLAVNCSFYMGETAMSIQKAAFRYRLPIDDDTDPVLETVYNCIVASTMLGSLFVMIPLSSEEHQLLQDVQEKLSVHPLTAPVLGNDHAEFRQRGTPSVVPPILDGDMLVQFLELTGEQQQAILTHALPGKGQHRPLSVFQVLQTLERVHYALN
ncbi:Cleavage and polyadenylation specificity factor (CPSF) A subunit protein [Zea mays]|uniref:Cleavage and polyadenylation specificity factor (CPSF) A subunit protein n=1 Tax=Zea mays TaxID=4577 RepID=A0A1D6HVI7_MAIZE|nr:Cleavage and polyadenylation specificity factor (CPSF) A subunit protein [Zea mays]ONM52287.1 Cleavage and polyadenylation specificity factor (CPSF) A subunit protein [Zea mays]